MTSENSGPFNLVCQVASQHQDQPKKLAEALGQAINPSTKALDIDKARSIVNGLPFGQVSKVHQQQFSARGKLSELVSQLKSVIGETMDLKIEDKEFWGQVDTALTQAFVGLKEQEGKPWISYRNASDGSTSYTYNLLFALLSKETGAVMVALPLTLDVTASAKKDEVQKLSANDTAKHDVSLKALTVLQMISPKPV